LRITRTTAARISDRVWIYAEIAGLALWGTDALCLYQHNRTGSQMCVDSQLASSHSFRTVATVTKHLVQIESWEPLGLCRCGKLGFNKLSIFHPPVCQDSSENIRFLLGRLSNFAL
jgi:hypothetical protein